VFDDGGDSDRSSVGKAIEDEAEAEPVIAVAVGDVDGRQVLSGGGDPAGQRVCLADGQERVDEDGVLLPGDEGRRCR
jgi:hypothetical protein